MLFKNADSKHLYNYSTIFKTFDNESIDKWTAKIGVFGKSFNDLGTAINNAFKTTIDNVDNFDTNIGFWESLRNNLSLSKDNLQNEIIDVDSLIPKVNKSEASEILSTIKSIEDGTNGSIDSFQALYDTGKKQNQWIAEYAQSTQGQIRSTEGVIAANKAARDSALQHNAALKAQTFGAKAASIGMKALAMAGNMLIFFAVTKGIELVAKAIDNYVHRLENAKEKLADITADIESVKDQLKETQDRIKQLEELEKNGSLSITDKEDLDNLRLQNEELGIRQKYLEEQQRIANRDVIEKSKEKYNRSYGYQNSSPDRINEYKDSLNNQKAPGYVNPYLTGDISSTSAPYAAGLQSQEEMRVQNDTLASLVAQYQHYEQALIDARNAEDAETIEKYNNKLSDLKLKLLDSRTELQGFRDDLSLTGEASTELDDVNQKLQLIDDTLLSKGEKFTEFLNADAFRDSKASLIELANTGKLTADELSAKFQSLDGYMKANGITIEELIAELRTMGEVGNESIGGIAETFSIDTYSKQLDTVTSSVDTLQKALDALNAGTFTSSDVLGLLQQFPALAPYIDMTASGFGNLAEGLHTLIEQQPADLIDSLIALKENLNTDEERVQIDALIDSLQALSSYGDTGAEAYATAITNTWSDTENVIEGVVNQFENLAKVQEAVANGLTMTTGCAAELAKIYPEILTNAKYATNGQVTLNEEVVKSILKGDSAVIDGQIAKLEADKAELTAKKQYAEAQLNILKQVGEGDGQISREVAQYRLQVASQLLSKLIEAGETESDAYATVAEVMSLNTDEFNQVVAGVAQDSSANMNNAAWSMADSIHKNMIAAQNSVRGFKKQIWSAADAMKAMFRGEKAGDDQIFDEGGNAVSNDSIIITTGNKTFDRADINNAFNSDLNLDDFQSKLELDIQGYTDAISNIDSQIEALKNLQSTFTDTINSANGGIGDHNYADKIKQLEKDKSKINDALKDKSGSKKTKEQYKEIFDFFERRTKVLNQAYELLGKNLDNVLGSAAKNKLINAQSGIVQEQMKNYADALNMYQEKANAALSKLDSGLQEKIKNGAVDLTTFVGDGNKDVVEAIKDYQTWADKVADCKQELAELKKQIRQLELDKFNNIIEEFTNQFDIYGDSNTLIEKQIDLLKEAGQLIGESFYSQQKEQSQKQLSVLEAEKAKLVEQLNNALSSGNIQKGTDEWLEMVNALSDVDGSILDCKKSIEEFDNAILELHWEVFQRIQDQFGNLKSEMENIIGLLDDVDVSDDKGNWSSEGLTQLGLYAQQYELAKYQVKQYDDEINQLNKDYLAGKYSATEYADKLAELKDAQWDAVNASEAAKDAIVDLNEARINIMVDGIEKEIDKYKELIDAQKKALSAEKELNDYKKSIREKTSNIEDLERQIAAMMGDTSAATIAKRKLKEEELEKAKQDLADYEADHAYNEKQDSLDKELEDFTNQKNAEIEALKATLEQEEALIFESFETIKANAEVISQQITEISQMHGIEISEAITSAWASGENAIASYGQVLSAGSSAFIGNIMGVENQVYQLQNDANITAASLANMFATRADVLVGELLSSYSSAANVNAMTQALHDSLIQTLEGGYNVSSITSALDSIADGANKVASAANNAAKALSNMGAAQSSYGSGGNSSGSSGKSGYSLRLGNGVIQVIDKASGSPVFATGASNMAAVNDYIKAHYAKGTRNATDGLAVTDEEGYELKLPKLKNGQYTLTNQGDQILTKNQTDNIFAWSKFNPIDYSPRMNAMPELLQKSNPNLEWKFENLVNIDTMNGGDPREIEKAVSRGIEKTFLQINKQLKYGGF